MVVEVVSVVVAVVEVVSMVELNKFIRKLLKRKEKNPWGVTVVRCQCLLFIIIVAVRYYGGVGGGVGSVWWLPFVVVNVVPVLYMYLIVNNS